MSYSWNSQLLKLVTKAIKYLKRYCLSSKAKNKKIKKIVIPIRALILREKPDFKLINKQIEYL